MRTKYEDWTDPITGTDSKERRKSSLNFKQLLGTVDTCVEKLYEEGASEKEIRERINKQITETINRTDRSESISEEVIDSIQRIKQEGDQLSKDDYDELLDLLQQIRGKIKK